MAGKLLGFLLGLQGLLQLLLLPPADCCACLGGGQVAPLLGATCSSNTRDMNSSLMAPCSNSNSSSGSRHMGAMCITHIPFISNVCSLTLPFITYLFSSSGDFLASTSFALFCTLLRGAEKC